MSRGNLSGSLQSDDQDRRCAPRAPIAIAVRSQVVGRTSLAQAADISRGGMLLAQHTERPFASSTRCWLEFSLPGEDQQIKARAEIIRQTRRGRYFLVAVRFRTIAPSHQRMINRYIRRPQADLAADPEPPYLFRRAG